MTMPFPEGYDEAPPMSAVKNDFTFDTDWVDPLKSVRVDFSGGCCYTECRLPFPWQRAQPCAVKWPNGSYDPVYFLHPTGITGSAVLDRPWAEIRDSDRPGLLWGEGGPRGHHPRTRWGANNA